MLCLAVTVIAFTAGCGSNFTSTPDWPPGVHPVPGPSPTVTVRVTVTKTVTPPPPTPTGTTSSCAYPDALLNAGLLSDAQAQYQALLAAQYPTQAPGGTSASTKPNDLVTACVSKGLRLVETKSQDAIRLEAEGDQEAAEGHPKVAAGDYASALAIDGGNTAAASGLQKVDQEQSDGIRNARDWWSQFVSNTLVPIGQFFLWGLAVLVVLYILWLLARIAAQVRWLSKLPSWRGNKATGWVLILLAAVATGWAARIGTSATLPSSHWLVLVGVAAALVVLGCALLASALRSGTGLHVSVTGKDGNPDKAACAELVGRLKDLGVAPPRGFDLPQSTDVTALNSALAVLPGGGMLSSLIDFLLERVPATPWEADVTLIDGDQLLVTLHHNRQLVLTELANRNSLLFPVPVPGKDEDGPSPDVTGIDQNGLLTVAAAVILVGMSADPRSPVKPGLNGASRWESVAGQVLATDQASAGKESFREALLKRAVDIDEGNLGARVAQVVLDGRWARDPGKREDFATRITEIADSKDLHYPALELRVFYSAAVGWYNVYLDSGEAVDLAKAFDWAKRLAARITKLTSGFRWDKKPLGELAGDMRPIAYMLGAALSSIPADHRGALKVEVDPKWGAKLPLTSTELYAQACLEAPMNHADHALDYLEQAIKIDDDLRLWARYDPSFTRLAADRRYHDTFVDAVGDSKIPGFTSVGPLAGYADKLVGIGVHTPGDLAGKASDAAEQQAVAQAMGVAAPVVARWCDIARLYKLQPSPTDSQVDALVAHDVDSMEKVRALRQDVDAQKEIASATLNTHGQITKKQLAKWSTQAARELAASGTARQS
jgi:hypothetical protein